MLEMTMMYHIYCVQRRSIDKILQKSKRSLWLYCGVDNVEVALEESRMIFSEQNNFWLDIFNKNLNSAYV